MLKKETIIVTGASSGIGKETALKLAAMNYHVIAGVLSLEDFSALSVPNIEPFILDITNQKDIDNLMERIQNDPSNLIIRALINNAGIEFNAPFELLPLKDWRNQFEVNLFGQVMLTKTIIPFLRSSHGTIVNITSVGGKVALANYSAYAATKFAFEAMSDSLRRELKSQNINVTIVETGGVKTEMAAYSGDLSLNFEKMLNDDQKKLYSDLINSAVKSQSNFLKHAMSAKKAGEKIAKITVKSRPNTRYSLGLDAKFSLTLVRLFPTKFVDWILEMSRKFA